MKKVGVISDTHNLLRPEVLEILKSCDCIIHAGDVCRPEILDQIRWLGELYVVRGNNDLNLEKNIAKSIRFTIENVRFVMAHMKRDAAIAARGADIIIYGHTHKYAQKTENQQLWLNPGSCGPRRFEQDSTMAILYVDGAHYKTEKVIIQTERK